VEANERLGFEADQRDYGIGVQILREIWSAFHAPFKQQSRQVGCRPRLGSICNRMVALEIPASAATLRYLTTKRNSGYVLRGL
jgi:3,4-dihydroxy 2-butanone 4-phosphate synthase/GTP cyclohydrolase II